MNEKKRERISINSYLLLFSSTSSVFFLSNINDSKIHLICLQIVHISQCRAHYCLPNACHKIDNFFVNAKKQTNQNIYTYSNLSIAMFE